jgi:hypothetical protein
MKSKATDAMQMHHLALVRHISKVAFSFFCPNSFNSGPGGIQAHANNFIFPAMASNRQVAFLSLLRIRLQAHKRASGWSLSGRSCISDSEH